ncbi:MAG: glycoside hydrolase family 9 protein [Syntrophothermus sp.]
MKIKMVLLTLMLACVSAYAQTDLKLNEKEYFEMPGLNIMVFHDYYPDGHQTGVTIVQHGERVAANGDIRLEPTPGQWSPMPKFGGRKVNKENNEISAVLWYPDSSKDRTGFNPIIYPDLKFKYNIRVKAEGRDFRIIVDLEKPVPAEWAGKIGFNLEFFPGLYFGKSYIMDKQYGLFPRQADGPLASDKYGELQILPMAEGNRLTVAPETDDLKMTISSENQKLYLYDGRGLHNNGWYVLRSLIPAGKTVDALEWKISANVIPGWQYKPVVQVSQIGYHPSQPKTAVIELDKSDKQIKDITLIRFNEDGSRETVLKQKPAPWGPFLRYEYYRFDFTNVRKPGIYQITYGEYTTNPFEISNEIYKRHVWQPTLEYFLPVQMCHMRVNEKYRVWHGLCHNDDALMAQTDTNHFDGYLQGSSTLTKFKPLEHVDGLNVGGWHDAGDYDLRIESQADEVRILSLAFEEFNVQYDATTVDQLKKLVEIHQPDGKPDILQQIEHGVLSIVGGYNALGRFYRGIICPTLNQYVMLGDAANNTDNNIYDPSLQPGKIQQNKSGNKDDNWVFTENNPGREISTASALAAAYRALKTYNPSLAQECLRIAEEVWTNNGARAGEKISAAVELFLATGKDEYRNFLVANTDMIAGRVDRFGWMAGRTVGRLNDTNFDSKITKAVEEYFKNITKEQSENPYGVPYHPDIWGAGWGIQEFGVRQYFLYKQFPSVSTSDYMMNALNFVLGCHPGNNTSSFASGIGAKSLTIAYGTNRADWSYIPGGVGSGTAIIRPDLPELKEWPYFWQQREYVMGGGASNFMFLVLAADKILSK